jgi:hypothetical protein
MRVVLTTVAVLLVKRACSAPTPSPTPCQVPRNCGTHNNSVVCGHKFTGCEFTCDYCCGTPAGHAACDGCTQMECKPVPPLPPSTTYDCLFPSMQCKQVAGSSGQFNSSAACAKICVPPTPPPAPPSPKPTPKPTPPPTPPPTPCLANGRQCNGGAGGPGGACCSGNCICLMLSCQFARCCWKGASPADCNNHRVQIFDRDGNYKRQF